VGAATTIQVRDDRDEEMQGSCVLETMEIHQTGFRDALVMQFEREDWRTVLQGLK
jgi:hypothetical protein